MLQVRPHSQHWRTRLVLATALVRLAGCERNDPNSPPGAAVQWMTEWEVDRYPGGRDLATDGKGAYYLTEHDQPGLPGGIDHRLRALTDSRQVKIAAVAPGLSEEQAGHSGMRLFADRESAAQWARSCLGSGAARGVIVRDAGNVSLRVVGT